MALQELLLLQPPLARLTLWLRVFRGDYQPRYYGSYSSDTATPTIMLRPASVETSACEMLREVVVGEGLEFLYWRAPQQASAELVDSIQVLEKHQKKNPSGSCSSPPLPSSTSFSSSSSFFSSSVFHFCSRAGWNGVQLPLLDL